MRRIAVLSVLLLALGAPLLAQDLAQLVQQAKDQVKKSSWTEAL